MVGVFEGEGIAHDVPGGALNALLESGEAQRKFKRLAVTHAEGRRFVLVGLGARDEFDAERARAAAAVAHGRARELGAETLCWEVPHHVDDEIVAGLVEGTLLHAYRFERYKPQRGLAPRSSGWSISAHHDVAEPVRVATILAGAQNRARDLGNTPANDLPPSALATYSEELAEPPRPPAHGARRGGDPRGGHGRVRGRGAGVGRVGPADPPRLRRARRRPAIARCSR